MRDLSDGFDGRAVARWAAAALVALSVHLGAVMMLWRRAPVEPLAADALPGVTIDVEPVEPSVTPITQSAPEGAAGDAGPPAEVDANSAAAAAVAEAKPDPQVAMVERTSPAVAEISQAPPAPPVRTVDPPPGASVPSPSPDALSQFTDAVAPAAVDSPPDLSAAEPQNAANPLAPPPETVLTEAPRKPAATPDLNPTEVAEARDEPMHPLSTQPPPTTIPAQTPSAAVWVRSAGGDVGEAGRATSGASASWHGKLVAHLNRFRRFPPGIGAGTAKVSFSLARDGRVTDVAVVQGSGSPALDAAAIDLIERASPFPVPPSDLGGQDLRLTVPVTFNAR